MSLMIIGLIIYGIIIVCFIGLVCFVQYNLSKSKNKYFGLIIPGIIFAFSVLLTVFFVVSSITKDKFIITTNDGKTYTYYNEKDSNEKAGELVKSSTGFGTTINRNTKVPMGNIILFFIVTNVGTLGTATIYFFTRRKSREDKIMFINDL